MRSSPTASGDYVKHASASGAKARFSFAGKNVAWVASTGSNRGKAEVWVDGVRVASGLEAPSTVGIGLLTWEASAAFDGVSVTSLVRGSR